LAEALKDQYGPEKPKEIASMLSSVYSDFDKSGFITMALDGYDQLSLTERSRHIANAMKEYLPDDYSIAIDIIIKSLGPRLDNVESSDSSGMSSFVYMPHAIYVSEYGLNHFELSMQAQYEITQRFTAEFSIRAFLEKYPKETLNRLQQWTSDDSRHVRRLVSEGTRPRLPWASRLPEFQKNPKPVIKLLDLLKDDEDLYVRRSVANNLNDISKDNPEEVAKIAKRWLKGADENRVWLVKHALRSAVKRTEPWALEILGFGQEPDVEVTEVLITPGAAVMGGYVECSFVVTNTTGRVQSLLIDLCIHYVKANGKTKPKVFKLKSLEILPGQKQVFRKKISLIEMTTRKHYIGTHKIDALLNGYIEPLGEFELGA